MVVTDVPVVVTHEGVRGVHGKPLFPHRTVALVFLSSVNDLTIRAVNYARSLDASVTRAIYFDLDPEAAHKSRPRGSTPGSGCRWTSWRRRSAT